MKTFEYTNFTEGVDSRHLTHAKDAETFTTLVNMYIDSRNKIRKRPGIENTIDGLNEPGPVQPDQQVSKFTRGLVAFDERLWTIGNTTNVSYSPVETAYWQLLVGDQNLREFVYAGVLLGGLYLCIRTYAGGYQHWYVVPNMREREELTTYAVGEQVLITGAKVPDTQAIDVTWRLEVQSIVGSGTTDPGVGPQLPFAHGDIIVDNEVTWKVKTNRIIDPNCPETPVVTVIGQNVYAAGALNNAGVDEHDIVRHNSPGDPFDWSTANEAGFLPVGLQSSGSDTPTALGKYDGKLAVIMSDTTQLWAVDPDPAQNALVKVIGGAGTAFGRTLAPVGTDMLYLTSEGIRSVSQQVQTTDIQDYDIGSPFDINVKAALGRTNATPVATTYPEFGQYWCIIGSWIAVWSWSRKGKVSAWSTYHAPHTVVDAVPLNGKLYVRTANHLLLAFNPELSTDVTGDYWAIARFTTHDLGSPGVRKQFIGADAVIEGEAQIAFAHDPNSPGQSTSKINVKGNTRPTGMTPIECCTTEIAPIVSYLGPDPLVISSLTLYYNELGLV